MPLLEKRAKHISDFFNQHVRSTSIKRDGTFENEMCANKDYIYSRWQDLTDDNDPSAFWYAKTVTHMVGIDLYRILWTRRMAHNRHSKVEKYDATLGLLQLSTQSINVHD
jgi:hypothetical protein